MQNYVGQIDYSSPGVTVCCSNEAKNCVELWTREKSVKRKVHKFEENFKET
jgi:hypothetical protein